MAMARKNSLPPNPDPWAPPLVAAGACHCGGRGVLWTFAWPRTGEPQHWVARRCWWCQPRPEFREEPADGSCDYCLGCGDVKARFFRAGVARPFGEINKVFHCPVCGDGEAVEPGKDTFGSAYKGQSVGSKGPGEH